MYEYTYCFLLSNIKKGLITGMSKFLMKKRMSEAHVGNPLYITIFPTQTVAERNLLPHYQP